VWGGAGETQTFTETAKREYAFLNQLPVHAEIFSFAAFLQGIIVLHGGFYVGLVS
jgi:hypothetical protein